MADSDIYVARENFHTVIDGEPISVSKGRTRVREGHPLLTGNRDKFEPLTVDYDVERATAAPGERRGRKPQQQK